jgi:hypothetical protein
MNTHLSRLLAGIVTTAAVVGATAPAALANGRDTVRRGSCSGSADWKVKVGPEDGRLEVEGEVDSNRRGQTWRWRLVHNGSVSAHGTRVTRGASGSFEVRRVLVDLRGTDTLVLRARNVRTGELCRGSVTH